MSSTTKPKKWYETPEFLAERKKAYAMLERSGFDDLEYTDWETGESMDLLRRGSTSDLRRVYKPDAERYYELARQWYWKLRGGHRSRSIWKLHSEGLGMRRIAEQLGVPESRVVKTIKREQAKMLKQNSVGDDE